jgi:hypothetical protein
MPVDSTYSTKECNFNTYKYWNNHAGDPMLSTALGRIVSVQTFLTNPTLQDLPN